MDCDLTDVIRVYGGLVAKTLQIHHGSLMRERAFARFVFIRQLSVLFSILSLISILSLNQHRHGKCANLSNCVCPFTLFDIFLSKEDAFINKCFVKKKMHQQKNPFLCHIYYHRILLTFRSTKTSFILSTNCKYFGHIFFWRVSMSSRSVLPSMKGCNSSAHSIA